MLPLPTINPIKSWGGEGDRRVDKVPTLNSNIDNLLNINT